MGNEGDMWLNIPVETKETEATMYLQLYKNLYEEYSYLNGSKIKS
jgi:hypothetical protein